MLEAIAARIEGKTYTPADLAQLVAEVKRLRTAIKEHAWMTEDGTENEHDLQLWAVLDA